MGRKFYGPIENIVGISTRWPDFYAQAVDKAGIDRASQADPGIQGSTG